jgi:hypothetical protein
MQMFAAFSIAQLFVLSRGIQIDCGCFGFAPSPIYIKTVLLSTTLLSACIVEEVVSKVVSIKAA